MASSAIYGTTTDINQNNTTGRSSTLSNKPRTRLPSASPPSTQTLPDSSPFPPLTPDSLPDPLSTDADASEDVVVHEDTVPREHHRAREVSRNAITHRLPIVQPSDATNNFDERVKYVYKCLEQVKMAQGNSVGGGESLQGPLEELAYAVQSIRAKESNQRQIQHTHQIPSLQQQYPTTTSSGVRRRSDSVDLKRAKWILEKAAQEDRELDSLPTGTDTGERIVAEDTVPQPNRRSSSSSTPSSSSSSSLPSSDSSLPSSRLPLHLPPDTLASITESSHYRDFEDRLEYVHRLLKQIQIKKLEELKSGIGVEGVVPESDEAAYELAMKRTAAAVAAVAEQPQILRARL